MTTANIFKSAKISQIMTKTSTILDGKLLASRIEDQIKQRIDLHRAKGRRAPGLGVILIGENPASLAYVSTKEKVAKRAGLESFEVRLPSDVNIERAIEVVEQLNQDPNIDGILLQLPIPKHLDKDLLLDKISPAKDGDGLHPINQGLLMAGRSAVRPCTPLGVLRLIDLALLTQQGAHAQQDSLSQCSTLNFIGNSLKGKHAIVIGRSILVGKPVALMLLERDATVTMAHSKTSDLAALCKEADIVVAASGVPGLVQGDWIKPGAIVIDVGTTRLQNGKLAGDVCFDLAKLHATAITPVPGGVGPMTVIMLIYNTLLNYEHSLRDS